MTKSKSRNNQVPRNNNQTMTNNQIPITKQSVWLLIIGIWNLFGNCILVIGYFIIICALPFVINIKNSCAQSISSSELIKNAKQYDGRVVVYEGEVIGDIMVRGGYAWINIHDGKNAIGIWIHKDLIKDILYTGSYKSRGDWVEITGIFQRICLEHGGDLDIHAQSLKKINPGNLTQEKLNLSKRNLVLVFLGILCLVWILTLLKRK